MKCGSVKEKVKTGLPSLVLKPKLRRLAAAEKFSSEKLHREARPGVGREAGGEAEASRWAVLFFREKRFFPPPTAGGDGGFWGENLWGVFSGAVPGRPLNVDVTEEAVARMRSAA